MQQFNIYLFGKLYSFALEAITSGQGFCGFVQKHQYLQNECDLNLTIFKIFILFPEEN